MGKTPTLSTQPHLEERMKDYYAVLGIEVDASAINVKNAYRKKASALHPDKNPSPDAAVKFREIQEAYDLLSDAAQRQAYDENRRRSLLENPLETAEEIWKTSMNKVLQ
jgi:DnaJ-class molecular chaperone